MKTGRTFRMLTMLAGGTRMQNLAMRLGVVSAVGVCLATNALARQVTEADLSGKTVCMSNGDRNTFGAGGHLSSNRFGSGTWAITTGGVQINAQYKVGYLPISRRSNGTFRIHVPEGAQELPYVVTGRYCN